MLTKYYFFAAIEEHISQVISITNAFFMCILNILLLQYKSRRFWPAYVIIHLHKVYLELVTTAIGNKKKVSSNAVFF